MSTPIRFISDPGHGWLEVPMSELDRLGIKGKISSFSYRNGDMAYLEEDDDAGTYLQALDEQGETLPTVEEVHEENTAIRGYRRFYV